MQRKGFGGTQPLKFQVKVGAVGLNHTKENGDWIMVKNPRERASSKRVTLQRQAGSARFELFQTQLCNDHRFKGVLQEYGKGIGLLQPFSLCLPWIPLAKLVFRGIGSWGAQPGLAAVRRVGKLPWSSPAPPRWEGRLAGWFICLFWCRKIGFWNLSLIPSLWAVQWITKSLFLGYSSVTGVRTFPSPLPALLSLSLAGMAPDPLVGCWIDLHVRRRERGKLEQYSPDLYKSPVPPNCPKTPVENVWRMLDKQLPSVVCFIC